MGKKFYAMMAVLAFAAGGMDVNAVSPPDRGSGSVTG